MSVTTRSIFRERAMDAYRRRAERDVVPRLTSGPVIACSWALLAVLVVAAVGAWSVRVPAYVAAGGVVVAPGEDVAQASATTSAVLFVPPEQAARLRVGQRVRGQVGSAGPSVQGTIASIAPGLIGPASARSRYGVAGADVLGEPARAVTVRLATALPASAFAGARVTARVEVDSQRLLTLVPGVGRLAGGGS